MERRQYNRILIQGFADIYDVQHNFLCRVTVRDLSPAGAAVISPFPLPAGSTVYFNIERKDGNGGKANGIEGEVLRIEKEEKGWILGVLFKNISPEKNRELHHIAA